MAGPTCAKAQDMTRGWHSVDAASLPQFHS